MFELIGWIAGICTAICFMPQTIKTLKSKDVQGLSIFSYAIYNIGILSWAIYGAYLGSAQMIIFNTISMCFAFTILIMIIKYRKKRC